MVDPLELPAAGAFLQQGARAAWVGFDTAAVRLLKHTRPARGFVLLFKAADGWRTWPLAENSLRGARTAAVAVVRSAREPMVLGQVCAVTAGGQARLVEAVAKYEPVTEHELHHRALAAADAVLALLQKADPPDPFNRRTFDRMVDELGDTLAGKSDNAVKEAVQDTVKKSTIVWANATEADYAKFSKALAAALGVAAGVVWKAVDTTVVGAAEKMAVAGARAAVKNHGLGVGYSLTRTDKVAVSQAARANQYYIRNFYTGTAEPALSARARQIAAKGIAEGQGSEVIANRMYRAMGNTAAGLNRRYMNVVSSAVNARARGFSSLLMMDRAGIRKYRLSSVLDENTTDTCRMLDGKVFTVGSALARQQRIDAMADPMDIRYEAPWTRERLIKSGKHKGKKGIFIPKADGDFERIAVIEQSAFGQMDKVGRYSMMSTADLASRGMGFPPFHAYCLLPGSPVLTGRGLVPVNVLRGGDVVLTHRWRWRRVVKVGWRWYTGQTIELRSSSGLVTVTADHPVLREDGCFIAAGDFHGSAIGLGDGALHDMRAGVQCPAQSCFREILFKGMPFTRPIRCLEGQQEQGIQQAAGIKSVRTLRQAVFCESVEGGSRKSEVLLSEMQGCRSCGWYDCASMSGVRQVGSTTPQRGCPTAGHLLLDAVPKYGDKARASEVRELQAPDERQEQPHVWPLPGPRGARGAPLANGRASEHEEQLRKTACCHPGCGRDCVPVRAPAVRDAAEDIPAGLPPARTVTVGGGEGVGAPGASCVNDGIQYQPWPDPLGGRQAAQALGVVRDISVARSHNLGVRVYSFSVEEDESFVAGNGVVLHNCRTEAVPVGL